MLFYQITSSLLQDELKMSKRLIIAVLVDEKLEKPKELAFSKSLTKFVADVVYFVNFRGAEDWKEGGRGGGRQASVPTGQLDFNGKN